MDTAESFRRFIEQTCGTDPGHVVADGKWHRFNIADTRNKSSKPGRYLLHNDERPVGVFMDWRDEKKRHRWFSDASPIAYDRAAVAAKRAARALELRAGFDAAATNARAYWDGAVNGADAAGHPYIAAKQIKTHGARVRNGGLLVPLYSPDGELRSLQQIAADGKRLFWKGAQVEGNHFPLGDFSIGPIVLCEGFSTGASIHEATGYPVIVCIDAGNMVAVSRWAGHKWAGRDFIVAADDDWHLPLATPPKPNKGRESGATAARNLGARLVVASLLGLESQGGDDFNDVAREYDLQTVAEQFEASMMDEPVVLEPVAEIATEVPANDRPIKATPFAWRAEQDIPKRAWIYGRHLLRKFLSVDVAAGGVGKSSLKIGEALAMATGQALYDHEIHEGPHRVWLYNLEDPSEETERRIHATAKKFGITPDDLGGRLFVDSGRDQKLTIAEESPEGVRICVPVVDSLIAELKERNIDVLIVDPFVSSHSVSENDNTKIDKVVKQWNDIADACNCSINLVHHVRKQNGTEATADSARGASAIIGAARSVMVFNRMSKDEAASVGVLEEDMPFFFRVDNKDKSNLAPPGAASWYRMNNVDLLNGDAVGVACPWSPPDVFAGITTRHLYSVQKAVSEGQWRENIQTKDNWVGVPIASALGLDLGQARDRKKVSILLSSWLREGVLEIVEMEDKKRMTRKFVVVGRWVEL